MSPPVPPRPRPPFLKELAHAAVNRDGYRSRFLRDTLFRVLPRLAAQVAVEGTDGLRYYISTRDTEVGRTLFVTGGFGLDVLDRAVGIMEAEGVLRRDRVFVDVGAHIGATVLPALRRHVFERCVAVEPDPGNAGLLDLNLVANGLADRVTVVRAAVTDHDGEVVLEHDRHNTGDHRVRTAASHRAGPGSFAEAARPTIAVDALTLDHALAKAGVAPSEVGVLWADVQGHEGHLLAGGTQVLAARPPLVLEYWPYALARAGGDHDVAALLAGTHPRFVDLRQPGDEVRTLADLGQVAARLGPLGHTDLLFLPGG